MDAAASIFWYFAKTIYKPTTGARSPNGSTIVFRAGALIHTRAITEAAIAKVAPTSKALWKPDTVAVAFTNGLAAPRPAASSALLVWLAAIPESTASPSAPPICCEVVSNPEAKPDSFCGTPEVAATDIATNDIPAPTANKAMPGKIPVR